MSASQSNAVGIGGAHEGHGHEAAADQGDGWLMRLADMNPLELWIEPGSEPIAGWLTHPNGERQAFGGWVELTAAIEMARRELAGATSAPGERG
jgi:hypothetical protein